MKKRRFLLILALVTLFSVLSVPQAFAGGYDLMTSYHGDGEFYVTFEEKVQQAEGTWTIKVGEEYYSAPIVSHTSKKVKGNQYHYQFENWNLKPGQYHVFAGFHGTVDGLEDVYASDEFTIEVTKDHQVKIKN
ncbi:hypothetical protein [Melghirimyces algeriensis]|uniref:Uncharacterized protein n=1 Tax=Melghirimyces algeriensis TaxID=910412 RepID=A0A521BUI2_9BACL|nr:hypothetical protein [Melghirimyces algeriensis]SMO50844.1 hypothetical protein SAMN06264849_102436 [Melghirimyces algeriensis]